VRRLLAASTGSAQDRMSLARGSMLARLGLRGVDSGRPPSRRALYALAFQHALFGVVPVLFTVYMVHVAASAHSFALDFHYSFWPAGQRVLHGLSPYVSPASPQVREGVAFVYPAVGGLLFGVVALIPHGLADAIFAGANLAAALCALRVLEVRDWRLYGLVALMPAVISGWQAANVTLLLVLGTAIAWRHREHPFVAGLIVAVMVSVKLFIWPLSLWLLATRRYAAFAWATGLGLLMNALAWGVLGFPQLHRYDQLVHAVGRAEERTAYTLMGLGMQLGAGHTAAYAVGLGAAALVALACFVVGRRHHDQSTLLLSIALSLLATPIVWRHYFALLIVPLAVARPRLSFVWLLPLALYVCPVTTPVTWQLLTALLASAAVVIALLRWPTGPARLTTIQGAIVKHIRQAAHRRISEPRRPDPASLPGPACADHQRPSS
jgi:Glycosyltransferase family 87